ncbi:Gfo/Idh/MocA family protein [Mesorhizobium sp. ESP-6-2]|nr:Gfo/Idh/MocA family oxidoreductase [Mesorhizobium sp. ESP-6-2]MBZ9811297.1 Gfo/Idh/MocA family oxidoreductase [Mesorhizobium sp. ESP-6-2]
MASLECGRRDALSGMGRRSMLRIGLLGAARVTPMAMVEPVARRNDVCLVAVASARPDSARAFAAAHNIPRFYDRYEDLIADADVDLIYNALAPQNHAQFSIVALEAGKHVLCEKPFAMSAAEARLMVAASQAHGRRLIEGFHDRYHPVFDYQAELIASGRLGRILSLRAVFNHAIGHDKVEFRHIKEFGGGALMDLGCYPVHWCRSFLGEEPIVETAVCKMSDVDVDEETTASLIFPSGVTAEIETRMTQPWNMHARFEILAERGRVTLINCLVPHKGHSIHELIDGDFREFTIAGDTSFDYQLEAVVSAINNGTPLPTEGDDPIGNMAAIDSIYAAAGVDRSWCGGR